MHKPVSHLKLSDLAKRYSLQLVGDGDAIISGVGTLQDASSDEICFLSNPAYREQLESTNAGAVILSENDANSCPVNALIADDPYLAYATIAPHFDPRRDWPAGIHPSAAVDPQATLGSDVHIGANSVIGPGCQIASGCFIGPGCVLIADCSIGRNSRLIANVTLCDGVEIGDRTTIHPGAVIGADGFGLAFDKDHWVKIPQLGSVLIGNDCEIGVNTAIDRGAIGNTIIEDDVRLDNQIQIGHNVVIGAHTAMAGRVGISGSTIIGKYCMFGGSAGTVGHIEIADKTTVNYCSIVTKSITEPGTIWSAALPARPVRDWLKSVAGLNKLEKLMRRVSELEKINRK